MNAIKMQAWDDSANGRNNYGRVILSHGKAAGEVYRAAWLQAESVKA
jgi:hypothetical protein